MLAAGDAMSVVVLILADGIRSSWRTRRRDAVSHIVKLLIYGAGLGNHGGIVTAVDAQGIRRRHNQADGVGLNLNRLLECTGVLQQMPGMEMMLLRLFWEALARARALSATATKPRPASAARTLLRHTKGGPRMQ